jgi:dihydroorotate dehydrogenase (fumarate)
VPIVASINCISSGEWTLFARKLEEAGADALELNMFVCPTDFDKTGAANEQFYFETISKVLQVVHIPVSIKISHYFSNLAEMVQKLALTGIAGITIFNRFYTSDIDVDNQRLVSAEILSSTNEYLLPLRWTGILSGCVACEIAATTGIHNTQTALKFLLAGASAIQISSVLYTEGPGAITRMNQGISNWMDQKGYATLADFRGSLSQSASSSQAWERVQFMKYFGEKAF